MKKKIYELIKEEIDDQYRWLMDTKHTLYDIDIAFSAIKYIIKKYIEFSEEPCEDCISRQAVLDINESHHGQMPNHINYQIWQEIKDLPPVIPKPKTDVLDKIRAEIQEVYYDRPRTYNHSQRTELFCEVMKIIDKYKAESEEL